MSINGTLVEAKMFTFTPESTHFIFNYCPIYPHDGASAKFSTNSQETDYRVGLDVIGKRVVWDGAKSNNTLSSLRFFSVEPFTKYFVS